jgi:dGTPase
MLLFVAFPVLTAYSMHMTKNLETDYNYCSVPLADFACRPDQSRGRLHQEPESKSRTYFQRDRDRIIHSSAFRRLKYKTQVFIYHEGDHFRTRLTHTLEVAQIARSIARALMVNEDLTETIALAHDLGHPPFAHTGEEELEVQMAPFEGFEHNDQSLRIVTKLEEKYPSFDGLNLTWETLEGIVKHNGPITGDLPVTLRDFNKQYDLEIETYASVEAQVAAIADDIAYNTHDLEDGLKAKMFSFDDFRHIELIKDTMIRCDREYPGLEPHRYLHFIIREMIGDLVFDVLTESRKRLKSLNPRSAEQARNCGSQLVDFSPAMTKKVNELRHFLRTRMYHNYKVKRMRHKSKIIVKDLFQAFMQDYKCLPVRWQEAIEATGRPENDTIRARIVADYIAGMTDRYAIREHADLFDVHEEHR